MPLTGSEAALAAELKPEIIAKIGEVFNIETDFGNEALDKFAQAVSEAVANKIVPHIVSNAVVKTTVSGVTAGGTTLNNQLGTVT